MSVSPKDFSPTDSSRTHESDKFRSGFDKGSSISILDQSKVGWSRIERDNNATTDVYRFYSLKDNALVDTLTITYESTDKEEIVSVVRS